MRISINLTTASVMIIASTLLLSTSVRAGLCLDAVKQMNYVAIQKTFDVSGIQNLNGRHGKALDFDEQQAAALLISIGAIKPADLESELLDEKLDQFLSEFLGTGKTYLGTPKDTEIYARVMKLGGHDALREQTELLNALQSALATGMLTGYDLRPINVSASLDRGRTLTYSHSSLLHIQQLISLLRREHIQASIWAAPKVSAFLFRDDWGEPSDAVQTLPDGTRVVNGREFVVFFEFKKKSMKRKFDAVVTRFAKKDEANETGLIADSWWQPFYYSQVEQPDLVPIHLVILRAGRVEATLTVLPENSERIVSALTSKNWAVTTDSVWVNKPFFRFLNGGYK